MRPEHAARYVGPLEQGDPGPPRLVEKSRDAGPRESRSDDHHLHTQLLPHRAMNILLLGALSWNPERVRVLAERGLDSGDSGPGA